MTERRRQDAARPAGRPGGRPLRLRADRPVLRGPHAAAQAGRAGPGARRNARLFGQFAVRHGEAEVAAGSATSSSRPRRAAAHVRPRARGRPGRRRPAAPRRAGRGRRAAVGQRPAGAGASRRDADLAIPDYDSLSASQVVTRLEGLTPRRARGGAGLRGGPPGPQDHPQQGRPAPGLSEGHGPRGGGPPGTAGARRPAGRWPLAAAAGEPSGDQKGGPCGAGRTPPGDPRPTSPRLRRRRPRGGWSAPSTARSSATASRTERLGDGGLARRGRRLYVEPGGPASASARR